MSLLFTLKIAPPPCTQSTQPKLALSTTIGDTCWQSYEKVEIIQNKMRTNVDFWAKIEQKEGKILSFLLVYIKKNQRFFGML